MTVFSLHRLHYLILPLAFYISALFHKFLISRRIVCALDSKLELVVILRSSDRISVSRVEEKLSRFAIYIRCWLKNRGFASFISMVELNLALAETTFSSLSTLNSLTSFKSVSLITQIRFPFLTIFLPFIFRSFADFSFIVTFLSAERKLFRPFFDELCGELFQLKISGKKTRTIK